MRTISPATQAILDSGNFTQDARPMVRATIQRMSVRLGTYGSQTYASMPFGQGSVPKELPNIKTVKTNRGIDGVATMTMVLYNTRALPLGTTLPDGLFDELGYYTPTRGSSFGTPSWTHSANEWRDWIVPDRIVRTYEGYGFDPLVIPELDESLYLSGVWLIDDVTFEQGTITLECRDLGRALIDQVLMPPIVPMASYPLYFEQYHDVDNPDIVTVSASGWHKPAYSWDSNRPNGFSSVLGHTGADAFDSSDSTYWLSVGNVSPNDGYSFEYIEGKLTAQNVASIRFKPWAGPYLCYVSVYANGAWQGTRNVPYNPAHPASAPNGANIRYVMSLRVAKETETVIKLPREYSGVTKVRLCFTNLYDSGTRPYRYRAGVRRFEVTGSVTTVTDGGTHVEPRTAPPGFEDYSDIIKHLLAYGGWHWPVETDAAFTTRSDGVKVVNAAPSTDSVLQSGRTWGDIELAGTGGVAPLGVDIWDKKPILDGVNYVKDILGYIFFIDHTGGAVFRSPNIWQVGNWVTGVGRTTTVVELDDEGQLLAHQAKLSSRSIREKVFVGNLAGQVAGMSDGRNPYPSGLRRVGGWTDQHFETEGECRIMADLITLRQLFTYRTNSLTIPGNPAIQPDDQVRIYERVSEEMYLHYVKSVTMDFDMKTGKYTYTLATHWLGDVPFTSWTFDPATMSAETKAYLEAMGRYVP